MIDKIELIKLGNLYGFGGGNYAGNVYDINGLSPTIRTPTGGGLEPMIVEPISTNGTEIAGCIRATYYKNGERNIIKNLENKGGYEGVIEPIGEEDEICGNQTSDK